MVCDKTNWSRTGLFPWGRGFLLPVPCSVFRGTWDTETKSECNRKGKLDGQRKGEEKWKEEERMETKGRGDGKRTERCLIWQWEWVGKQEEWGRAVRDGIQCWPPEGRGGCGRTRLQPTLPAPPWPQELMGRQFWFLISTRFKAWFLGRSKYNEHTREEEDRDSVKSFNGNWLSRSLPESWKPRWTANSCDLSLTVWRAVHIALPRERVSED